MNRRAFIAGVLGLPALNQLKAQVPEPAPAPSPAPGITMQISGNPDIKISTDDNTNGWFYIPGGGYSIGTAGKVYAITCTAFFPGCLPADEIEMWPNGWPGMTSWQTGSEFPNGYTGVIWGRDFHALTPPMWNISKYIAANGKCNIACDLYELPQGNWFNRIWKARDVGTVYVGP